MALVNYDNSDDDDGDQTIESDDGLELHRTPSQLASDTVEAEYRMRMPKSAKLPSLIPNFSAQKSKSGKIMLSVPSLETLDSSSDEEFSHTVNPTESPRITNRIKKPSNHPTRGLLEILPPTRCNYNRDGPKPALMIPQQVAMKRVTPLHPAQPKEVAKEAIPSQILPTDDGNSEDDDESSGTFFSFYKPTPETPQAVANARAAAMSNALRSVTNSFIASGDISREPCPIEQPDHISQSVSSTSLPSPIVKTPSLCSIDPELLKELDIPKKGITSDKDTADEEASLLWTEQTFVPEPERKRARLSQPGVRSLPVHDILLTSNRSIREVNQADLTAGADIELMKSVTSDESQYISQRAIAEDDPGKLAHRKHQITWLAHQAQANEMELEKRWAEARRNKASNRAKYGF